MLWLEDGQFRELVAMADPDRSCHRRRGRAEHAGVLHAEARTRGRVRASPGQPVYSKIQRPWSRSLAATYSVPSCSNTWTPQKLLPFTSM